MPVSSEETCPLPEHPVLAGLASDLNRIGAWAVIYDEVATRSELGPEDVVLRFGLRWGLQPLRWQHLHRRALGGHRAWR